MLHDRTGWVSASGLLLQCNVRFYSFAGSLKPPPPTGRGVIAKRARVKVVLCQLAKAKGLGVRIMSIMGTWLGPRALTKPLCWLWKWSLMMRAATTPMTTMARSPQQRFPTSARVRFTNACGECFAPERTVVTWSQSLSSETTRTKPRDPPSSVLSNVAGMIPCLVSIPNLGCIAYNFSDLAGPGKVRHKGEQDGARVGGGGD